MFSDTYVIKSLELHLFFARIMKEHSLFLEAGFTPANPQFQKRADFFKKEFERVLCRAVELGDGVISREVLCSGELVTQFTPLAEKQTECLTSIQINKMLTEKEMRLKDGLCRFDVSDLHCSVQRLNRNALELLNGLIGFKETVLKKVLCCDMFTANYPLLLEHIIREAKLYREYICMLEKDGDLTDVSMKETECFWNRIMMEHAEFIRGLLDPTEDELMKTANDFAIEYQELLKVCCEAQAKANTDASLEATKKFREFKTAGVQGIESCRIRSVILPLLADHVLREANHYIRLLEA